MALYARELRRKRVDAFTYDDFKLVSSKLAADPSRLVLVGGQALNTWAVFLEVPSPGGLGNPLTEDTDWLGGKLDAKWLCGQLPGKIDLQFADFDGGPVTAVARLLRPDGRVLLMDFLHCIVGPNPVAVRRLAVPVQIDGLTLHVLHPILCLHSRFANLHLLPAKRNSNGLLQARWALQILTAYLREIAKVSPGRPFTRACHRIAKVAETKAGRYCFMEYGLDALEAIPAELIEAESGRFLQDDWPRTVDRLHRKREKWARFAERQGTVPPSKTFGVEHDPTAGGQTV